MANFIVNLNIQWQFTEEVSCCMTHFDTVCLTNENTLTACECKHKLAYASNELIIYLSSFNYKEPRGKIDD